MITTIDAIRKLIDPNRPGGVSHYQLDEAIALLSMLEHERDQTEHIRATAPALLKAADYFDYAAPHHYCEDLDDEEYVTITVTVKAIRDLSTAIKQAKGEVQS